jgi:hypothetical protein
MTLRLPSILVLCAVAIVSGAANAQTTTAPNPFGTSPEQTAPAPQKAPAVKKPRAQPAPKAGQFASEAEAKARCPGETVVWVNTSTKVWHYAGAATYGKTKRGVYMCEKEAGAGGFRAAKNEKR